MAARPLDADGHVAAHAARVTLASAVYHGVLVRQAVGGSGADPQDAVEVLHPPAEVRAQVLQRRGHVLPRDVAERVGLIPVGDVDGAVLQYPVRQQPAEWPVRAANAVGGLEFVQTRVLRMQYPPAGRC